MRLQQVPDPVPPGNIPPPMPPTIPDPDPSPLPVDDPGDTPLPPITDPDVDVPGGPTPGTPPTRALRACVEPRLGASVAVGF